MSDKRGVLGRQSCPPGYALTMVPHVSPRQQQREQLLINALTHQMKAITDQTKRAMAAAIGDELREALQEERQLTSNQLEIVARTFAESLAKQMAELRREMLAVVTNQRKPRKPRRITINHSDGTKATITEQADDDDSDGEYGDMLRLPRS